jgi:hypothetical protein
MMADYLYDLGDWTLCHILYKQCPADVAINSADSCR